MVNEATPLPPWGKLARHASPLAAAPRLSLLGHSLDVAAVTRALLALPVWRRRLERLAGRAFSSVDIDRLTVLAFLHDVGKAGLGFQAKAWPEVQQAAWRRRHGVGREQQGHTRTVAALLGLAPEFAAHRDALGVADIRAWGGAPALSQQEGVDLWLAAISHHGEPLAFEPKLRALSTRPHPTWTDRSSEYEPLAREAPKHRGPHVAGLVSA